MPTITENVVPVWLFCPDGACPEYICEEVEGIAREVSRSVIEEGNEMCPHPNAESTSFMQYLIPSGETDEYGYSIAAELECGTCGRTKQVSPTPRPEYTNSSGQDPMTLLNRRAEAQRGLQRDSEVTMLRTQLEAQQAQMTALLAGLASGQQEPKRKAKPEDEAA